MSNFKTHLYVFEGNKSSNGDKHTELASTVDLENLDQLPVTEVFEGMCLRYYHKFLFIHTNTWIFKFSRSRNPLLTFLQSYHFWVTSKIQVNSRFKRFSEVLMILFHGFSQFLHYLCFRGQAIHFCHSY